MPLYALSTSHAVIAEAKADKPAWDQWLNQQLPVWVFMAIGVIALLPCLLGAVLSTLVLAAVTRTAPWSMPQLQQLRRGTADERALARNISADLFPLRDLVVLSPFTISFVIYAIAFAYACGMFRPGSAHWLP